eukprot:TRINITY_DN16226_c0_g1_i2.p1 TRINITY_DN16226_c0_g1~~TRINITY_DN16226_c0_g1_i2.p1  ORF type:complete len:309 (-),score=31.13 TRINITY_DN16226_c0_g1_i2:72-998(-)
MKSLKTTRNQFYYLCEGDIIKLGRLRFRVKELSNQKFQQSPKTSACPSPELKQSQFFEEKISAKTIKSNEQSQQQLACRICLQDDEEQDNPFISPCKCTGTMQYIHLQCLQAQMKSRMRSKSNDYITSILWTSFNCDICKAKFPQEISVNNKIYNCISLPKPSSTYIILEILSKDTPQCRGFHIIDLANKASIVIGRGHEADLRISDISVSREHALLNYDHGKFFIQDKNSKFGTLLLLQKPFPINFSNNNNMAVQINRTVMQFHIKKKWSITPSCFRNKIEEINDEEICSNQNNVTRAVSNLSLIHI